MLLFAYQLRGSNYGIVLKRNPKNVMKGMADCHNVTETISNMNLAESNQQLRLSTKEDILFNRYFKIYQTLQSH